MTGAILVNLTQHDFNTAFVKPEEFGWYSPKVYSPEDYFVDTDNDRIEVITNLVITANQTQGYCPNNVDIAGAMCDPDHNHCKKGGQGKFGVYTGECVPADLPYFNKTSRQWEYGHSCQVFGRYLK